MHKRKYKNAPRPILEAHLTVSTMKTARESDRVEQFLFYRQGHIAWGGFRKFEADPIREQEGFLNVAACIV